MIDVYGEFQYKKYFFVTLFNTAGTFSENEWAEFTTLVYNHDPDIDVMHAYTYYHNKESISSRRWETQPTGEDVRKFAVKWEKENG